MINLFNLIDTPEDYIAPLGVSKSELNSTPHLFNKLQFHSVNLANASLMQEEAAEDDYQGRWEDAFLFSGFDKGKHSFLTSIIAEVISRHGFIAYTTNHRPWMRPPPSPTPVKEEAKYNEIIVDLMWKDQHCIPDRTKSGDKVIIGVTEPRLYLPDVVCKLLDLEFGYDKEIYDKDTVERQVRVEG